MVIAGEHYVLGKEIDEESVSTMYHVQLHVLRDF